MKSKKCDFCGKPSHKYIEGLNSVVCYSCVNIMDEDIKFEKAISNVNKESILKPHELKAKLDEYIIGQDEAKIKLAVEVYSHYRRIALNQIEIPKNNILFIGPSGCGKTYILEKLSELIDVPIAFGDATGFTKAGYYGKDVDTILKTLIQKANGDVKKAERGIVFIDEIDKIARPCGNIEKVGTEGVQQSLLTIMNGCEYVFDKKDIYDLTPSSINTKNILFIVSGAFDGIEDIIKKRLSPRSAIGFNTMENKNPEDFTNRITTQDLLDYGFIREFIGRIHLIATLNKLTKDDMYSILTKSKDSILKQYKMLFKVEGISLKFTKDAIDYIVNEALNKNTGARGLKTAISDKMNMLLYKLLIDNRTSIDITAEILKTGKY